MQSSQTSFKWTLLFFQLLTTSPQWQANFDVRTWTDFRAAVEVRCQHDRKHVLSHQKLLAAPAPIFYIFCLKKKKNWTHKCKNEEKKTKTKIKKQSRTLQMICIILIYVDGMVSGSGESRPKLYFAKFHIWEVLCWGNVFLCSIPCSVKMRKFAVP